MTGSIRNAAARSIQDEYAAANHEREFDFSEADFRSLAKLAYEQAGIVLSDSKRNLVYGRLSRRLRALGMSSFRQYREYLANDGGRKEVVNFINSISTNLTKFFRESHHFDHLRTEVAVPFGQALRGMRGRRLRIWSAGCSSGEEAYTIAVVLKREIPDIARHDVRILATDIDTNILAKAALGEYPQEALEAVPKGYRGFFQSMDGGDGEGPTVTVSDDIRSLITFRQLNLIGPWPFSGLFDVIFCRNVMIYFDGPTKEKLIGRFTAQIKPGGWLCIGHSESIHGSHPGLKLFGRTIYGRAA
jgi:chemotaxis protein methyltransferase CheR